MFCPNWIFDISVARVAGEFLSSDLTLDAYSKKYSEGINKLYPNQQLNPETFSDAAQNILEFLSEVEAGDQAVDLISNFTYFRLYYVSINQPRKMKSMFGSIEDSVKTNEVKPDLTLKSFRAFVFGLRSNTMPLPQAGWKLDDDDHLINFKDIINKQVSILDVI
ncbi:hypothetical protein OAT37_01075 [Alphaproteobacteria bacterium]|nr:hypothetical protein [Alphaproteobacteria bacterium]